MDKSGITRKELETLVIFERWMQATADFFRMSAGFPKRLRPSLTARMENLFLRILELLTSAAYTKNRTRILDNVDDCLNRLRMLIRLSHKISVISDGQYEHLARELTETGRMLGGWKKSSGYAQLSRSSQSHEPTVDEP